MQNVHSVLDVSPIPPVVDSIDYTLLLGVAAAAQCRVRFARLVVRSQKLAEGRSGRMATAKS